MTKRGAFSKGLREAKHSLIGIASVFVLCLVAFVAYLGVRQLVRDGFLASRFGGRLSAKSCQAGGKKGVAVCNCS
jgi:hypothetical protein